MGLFNKKKYGNGITTSVSNNGKLKTYFDYNGFSTDDKGTVIQKFGNTINAGGKVYTKIGNSIVGDGKVYTKIGNNLYGPNGSIETFFPQGIDSVEDEDIFDSYNPFNTQSKKKKKKK